MCNAGTKRIYEKTSDNEGIPKEDEEDEDEPSEEGWTPIPVKKKLK